MNYLNYSKFEPLLSSIYADSVQERLVGRARCVDSGYSDISRFYGPDALNPRQIEIRYRAERFSFRDPLVASYSKEIADKMRKEKRLFYGPPVMAVTETDLTICPPFFEVAEASFDDIASTCLALDYRHALFEKSGGTLRDYYMKHGVSTEIGDSLLCLGLGVCGFLLVENSAERHLLTTHRSSHLSSLSSTWGASAAGVVDFVPNMKSLAEIAKRQMVIEIHEEIGLWPNEYFLTILAFGRELFRGERPQLFCLMQTKMKRDQIVRRLDSLNPTEPKSREFDKYEFMKLTAEKKISDEAIEKLNHEARMNYYLVEEYL